MEDAIQLYRTLLGNRAYLRSLCEGAAFLAASAIAIFASVTYATVHASNYVTDFVLSRVGPLNVRFLFIYGTFAAFAITVSLLAWRPNRLPFALKATALFLLVRAVFVALTHMAPSPIDPQKAAPFFNSIFYGSDLFFSGHTGLPFLAALAFWHIPQWRMFYLALTAFFGSVVLLGHYHYSIDVLAALFITHGVFQISCWLFGRDYALFRSSENPAAPRSKRASRWLRPVADVSASPNRLCCTSSETRRCQAANPKPNWIIRTDSPASCLHASDESVLSPPTTGRGRNTIRLSSSA